jgi:hypothetical protein
MSAIEGFVPKEVVQTFHAFLDFYYLVRRNVLDEDDLEAIEDALERFYAARAIFQEVGVRPTGFSLPRQHAMKHYVHHILKFGAPNGLCSSITESTHITAVKKPWRRSSRNNAMEQILIINERTDKLSAARSDFVHRGMLTATGQPSHGTASGSIIQVLDEPENGPVDGPIRDRVTALAQRAGKLFQIDHGVCSLKSLGQIILTTPYTR